ncbi:MAG TPA: thiamine pyrophosphate-binding protein [Alphaproteobacteria bacterium]|nr:MAG: Sulfoacetaldehyde acetyltransferase [Alphaproteobacteria bacterium MarineAlpha9_Bin6]PPR32366.1 MAG: Sulfoacetaldehyde acetyltransferase [Alphaproteobacteria bacterium MarineAlpha9_Bin5]HIC73413.1 thiamine pyrophosphate-binding protein [Alphaproteobacteria bacterium]HIM72559.1 thiamine pyrophosphate-binding protein [Alphaproteobacteria bacterium]
MNTPLRPRTEAAHPRQRLPVYEVLARDVQALGIEAVFGLVSDDTAMFATALDAIGIRFHGARHENSAITMAEGYAAASGQLGVAVVGRGPATANGMHGAVYTSRTESPVLIIYGEAPVAGNALNAIGPDYKEFNTVGVLSAAGIQVFRATSASGARTALADAVAAAQLGSTVALLLPTNVQRSEIEVREDNELSSPTPSPRPLEKARSPVIDATVEILKKSRRPLIVAGFGAHRAGAREVLERLADKIGALLITSARGKDMFCGNPYNLGIIGSFSHSAARRFTDQTDCVLVFGASLNFWTTSFGNFVPPVPLIQVDARRRNIGKWSSADIALVGDARLVAEQLLNKLPERSKDEKTFHSPETRRSLATFDLAEDFQATHTARTLDPRSLGIALDKILPKNRNLVYDAGNFLGIVPYISVPGPGHFKFTNNFASIGLGFGTALGVARARPDSVTVLVVGDGGFLMTLGELETVVREDLPLVIVVLNDCAYGAELHFLKMHQLPVTTSVFPDVDFAPIAEGFAFQAATIRSMDDLHRTESLLKDPKVPVLLDCKINADIAAPFMGELAAFESGED